MKRIGVVNALEMFAKKGIKIDDITAIHGFNIRSTQPRRSGNKMLETGTYFIYSATDSIWPTNRLGLMWGKLGICIC